MRSVSDNAGIDDDGASVTDAVDELFAGVGSDCAAVTVAVLAIVPPAAGAATTRVIVDVAPLANVAMLQVIVDVPPQMPPGLADTNVLPAGRTSVTVTPVAAAGPPFATAIV